MSAMLDTARKFFEACETGKGWDGCKAYCTPDASFSAQSTPLLETKTARSLRRLDEKHVYALP